MNKAIFIDKDGTLIPDIPYNVNPKLITLSNTAIPALQLLQKQTYLLIVISNQSGVARGYFKEEELQNVSDAITTLLSKEGITVNGFYYCPHHKEGTVKEYTLNCDCRKPKPGLILKAVKDFSIDVTQSWMIGDILNDVEAGKAAGCKTVLLKNGNETEWLMNDKRQPDFVVENLLEAAQTIVQHS
ncbi:MAG: HAD family hydrolase [Bacteroidota bacterium]|nr:HAD family hydrolase [Bacteroidota bacterium]